MAGAEQKIINVKIKGVNDLLKLKKALKDLKDEQKKVTKVNKEGEKEWKDKERAIDKATTKIKQNRKALLAQSKAQKKSTASGKKMGAGMLKMAATITAVVGTARALSRVFVSAFKTFTEFEFSMAKVRAISGATNEEFMKLTQSAKELGRTTFFTATEVAELQVNFSKLGFTAEQILNLQGATLDLAMATGSDLARSAMVAGSAVRGFGLDASEATRVVDVMAVSFTSSALDIEKWQTSMTKVSAIAASIGVDIEGTAAVMGSLADTGIEASIAGTSLRNIFLKMANPTSALAKRIGFTVNSTEDMVKALKKLKDAQIGQLEMQSLVDVRQVIAMQGMIQNVETIEQYTFALNNAEGAGREMSAIMEDSTKGAFKRFTSAMEGLFLVLSEKIAPWINKITKGTREWIEMLTGATDKKISDRIGDQVKEFNNLFKVLLKSNALDQTKEKTLKEINRKYSEYLGYQLTDINDVRVLTEAQKELNDQFIERIKIQVSEERLSDFYKEQYERADRLLELQKKLGDSPLGTMKTPEDLFKEGAEYAMQDAIALFDFISDLKVNSLEDDGEVSGFMQKLEAGLVFGTAALNNMWAIPKAFIKDMDAYADFVTVTQEIVELQKKVNMENKTEADLKAEVVRLGGKLKGILGKTGLKPCTGNQHRDPITGECVDPVAVRNFTKELAAYRVSVSDKASAIFIANEETRNLKILEKSVELAKAEFDLFQHIEDQKDKYMLKLLQAREKLDRARLKVEMRTIDESLKKELEGINELKRKKTHSALDIANQELIAERAALAKKLKANEDYFIEWLKIKNKMNDVDEKIYTNEYLKAKELENFKVDLISGMANMTMDILKNTLSREYDNEVAGLDKIDEVRRTTLDNQLKDGLISQANYDGAIITQEKETNDKKEELEIAYAKKQKKIALTQVIIDGALAIAKAYAQAGPLGTFVVPLLIAQTAMQYATVSSAQFKDGGMIEEFADGGMVNGRSHAQGGEKFSVGGRVVELEGGEAVINKRSTAMFKEKLSAINQAGGGAKFADGGLLNNSSFTSARFNSLGLGGSNNSGRVVVVESEITQSQRKVKAIQSNASF